MSFTRKLLYKRFIKPLIRFLYEGISPSKLALTLALGITLGVVPVFGVNTAILTLLAIILRLNLISIQIVNYSVYALQFLLYIPFLKAGQFIFNGPPVLVTINDLVGIFHLQGLKIIVSIWQNNLLGLLVWLIISIPSGFAIYYLTLPVFRKLVKDKLLEEKVNLP